MCCSSWVDTRNSSPHPSREREEEEEENKQTPNNHPAAYWLYEWASKEEAEAVCMRMVWHSVVRDVKLSHSPKAKHRWERTQPLLVLTHMCTHIQNQQSTTLAKPTTCLCCLAMFKKTGPTHPQSADQQDPSRKPFRFEFLLMRKWIRDSLRKAMISQQKVKFFWSENPSPSRKWCNIHFSPQAMNITEEGKTNS